MFLVYERERGMTSPPPSEADFSVPATENSPAAAASSALASASASASAFPAQAMPDPTTPDVPEQRKKRQKIAVACDTCRARKVKCDGNRPVCGVCAKKKDKIAGCRYSEEKRQEVWRATNPNSVPGSQYRSRELSVSPHPASLLLQFNRQAVCLNETGKPISTPPDYENGQVSGQGYHQPTTFKSPGDLVIQEAVVRGSSGSNPGLHEPLSTGGDSMTGAVGSDGQAFFGSSSASSFMKQIKAAVDYKVLYPNRPPAKSGAGKPALFALSPNTEGKHSNTFEYILPSRRIADELVSVYWELVHPLYPFLDRQRTEQAYKAIWSGESTRMDERLLMCTINVMFALGCQLAKTIAPEQRQASANVYFKRAQDLLQLDLWGAGSTDLVQCLLLMGQYLQSTNTHHQCWMVIGHAVRVAQSLGFHLPESSSNLQSPRERELARRIWHGCVLMDRVLSMTFGRPAMIAKTLADSVPLPAMIDDDYLPSDSSSPSVQPDNTPSAMAFFVKSLNIYDIVNDILAALYEDESQKDQFGLFSFAAESSNIDMVFRLDRALMNWGRTLPPHLRISSYESFANPLFKRQAIICRSRFLHTRILLFRPILSKFCLPEAAGSDTGTFLDESLAQRIVLQCSTLCLRAAHDLIDIIYMNLTKDGTIGPLPAWWYCVFYLYTAATVLLAARLRPVIEVGITEYSAASSWAHAIESLKYFELFGESAQRCVAALEILSAKVSLSTEGNEPHMDGAHAEPSTIVPTNVQSGTFDQFQGDLDFSGITFDLNDMSWLNSGPGIL